MTEVEVIYAMADSIINERGKTYNNFLEASVKEFGFNIGAKFYRFERNDLCKLIKGETDINPDTALDLINYLTHCLIKTGSYKKHYHYKKIMGGKDEATV